MPNADEFAKVFETLRAQYERMLPGKLAALDGSFAALQEANPPKRELLETFHRQVHSLTGSGASYGFPELSQTARALELILKQATHSPADIRPPDIEEIRCRLEAVKRSVSTKTANGASRLAAADTSTMPAAATEHYIAILGRSPEQMEALSSQLLHFGYHAKIFESPALLLDCLADLPLAALILDAADEAEVAALAPITAHARNRGIPLVFTSDQTELSIRLAAVRAGGVAFFAAPVDAASLVDQLDRLSAGNAGEPYRVLIVDDQPIDAALYASALDSVGMITHIINDPGLTLNALREFNPDLVLLDMYMPSVSGEELAQVIRQQSAYVSIPLVFLSAETDVEKQLEAMRNGADDFLTKPINLQHLVASVTTRTKRYRELRSFMQRDSLTGLLNHTKSKEYLDTEVARAERENWPLAFAMVDIDHFKQVNDTFGHPVGDRVIKSIARLLQQRLRRSDVIGRYGGEEFAVILSNTSGETAARVMDEIRIAFSQIPHQAEGAAFSATFSCGVAEFRTGMSTNELANEADKALYQAKRRGRNQVVLA